MAFNEKLKKVILKHPNFTSDWDPAKRAIRGGAVVPRLFDYNHPILKKFEVAIVNAVSNYMRNLQNKENHPFLGYKPAQYTIDIWANVLGSNDHQSSHIHNQGWMSGVYYVPCLKIQLKRTLMRDGWNSIDLAMACLRLAERKILKE